MGKKEETFEAWIVDAGSPGYRRDIPRVQKVRATKITESSIMYVERGAVTRRALHGLQVFRDKASVSACVKTIMQGRIAEHEEDIANLKAAISGGARVEVVDHEPCQPFGKIRF